MKLSLSLDIKVTVLVAVLMPVLLLLGNWQLQRAEEKRAIRDEFITRQRQAPVSVIELSVQSGGETLAFTPVSLLGRFDNQHHFLLDNRMHRGQLGYEVLTPLLTDNGQWVLVNRGWVKAKAERRDLPAVPAVEGAISTVGTVYVPPGKPFLLARQIFRDVEWPLVVQAIEVDKFASLLNRDFFPHVMRLRKGAPGALTVDWQPVNVQPEKHTAYAVQWFAMAAALALWFLFANTNAWQVLKEWRRK
jgi:surfeit locus 1 family protein